MKGEKDQEKYNPYLEHLNQNANGKSKRIIISRRKCLTEPEDPETSKKNITLAKNSNGFIFGNYHGYYNYRKEVEKGASCLEDLDPRLLLFKKEWFADKKVLDVGCNAGKVSIDIAKLFQPSFIEGVDIDPVLISKARYNLSFARSQSKKVAKDLIDFEYFPISCPLMAEEHINRIKFSDNSSLDPLSTIQFRCGDWVHEPMELAEESFDVILALSISKWIHLNNGDGGIRHFFNRCFQFLNPKGILILEPQPFEGYAKRASLSAHMRDNYNEISFFPVDFLDFLTKKVGFKLIEALQPPPTVNLNGFKRIMYILQKS